MNVETSTRPQLSVRVDVGDESTTRTCHVAEGTFDVGTARGTYESVAVEEIIAHLTCDITAAGPDATCAVAAVVTADEGIHVYALAERRDGVWTDRRQPLKPVETTWEDVRSGIVLAALDLLAAQGVTS
ncbi:MULTISPECIES: hypothetical protein [Dermacoccus]|uniref:Uncharacterized protein n=3 Tax=Dermacoccus TaxID=57495 RepID=A0A417Z7L7_9MICO|nr:hypothetical protein [Dermacoccus abyssi]RHW46630.1 hypothetical protein D1832_05195 [Dermacoccus abyssi]